MASDDEDDKTVYLVLMNCEEQYSLWPKFNAVPKGWEVKKEGSKAECLAYVKEVWTDMRPLSLRKHMEEFERKKQQQAAEQQAAEQQTPQQQSAEQQTG
jgi:MbtH protein